MSFFLCYSVWFFLVVLTHGCWLVFLYFMRPPFLEGPDVCTRSVMTVPGGTTAAGSRTKSVLDCSFFLLSPSIVKGAEGLGFRQNKVLFILHLEVII